MTKIKNGPTIAVARSHSYLFLILLLLCGNEYCKCKRGECISMLCHPGGLPWGHGLFMHQCMYVAMYSTSSVQNKNC